MNRRPQRTLAIFAVVMLLASFAGPKPAAAQLAPEIGYVLPAGGAPGTTFDAVLGGYDWTPDMQVFSHDPRVKIEIVGPPSPVLVPEPPYWFGAKARGPAWPLPREFPARITIGADVPPGIVRWQVANANGASPPGMLHIGAGTTIAEDPKRRGPQSLPSLPVTVSGQIRRIEEVDSYSFRVSQDGPVTLTLVARQIGSPLHGIMRVIDDEGRKVVDAADTLGRDLTLTFAARAAANYVVQLHDLDFAGDRSYVYRLELTPGPRVVAAFPICGKRGTTQKVEFWGWGVATGAAQLESTIREVSFPNDAATSQFAYQLETPLGKSRPWTMSVADETDEVEPPSSRMRSLARVPIAITGAIEAPFDSDEYSVTFTKDTTYQIVAQAKAIDSPIDLDLSIVGPDGKELMTQDDVPGTTDPQLIFKAPADGAYRIVLTDRAGLQRGRSAFYRLDIRPSKPDFTSTLVDRLAIPLGAKAKLAVPIVRKGGFQAPLTLQLKGLPEGIKAPNELVIAADKSELAIELECAADAPATASRVDVLATTEIDGKPVVRQLGALVVATTLKQRIKITPEGLDDVRKVHRGSTYLAPLLIERLEGYAGPITLEMTSKQQRHRQGLASDEFTVAADAARVEYPIFVPEWMETTKTSRMILNGAVQIADPRGTPRTLLHRMELRIGILPEGALLKVTPMIREPQVAAGATLALPIKISRAPEFQESVKVEVRAADGEADRFDVTPLMLTPNQSDGQLEVRLPVEGCVRGRRTWTIRATALQQGRWPVVSESTVEVDVR